MAKRTLKDEQIDKLKALVRKFMPTDHTILCQSRIELGMECTCGLAEARELSKQ